MSNFLYMQYVHFSRSSKIQFMQHPSPLALDIILSSLGLARTGFVHGLSFQRSYKLKAHCQLVRGLLAESLRTKLCSQVQSEQDNTQGDLSYSLTLSYLDITNIHFFNSKDATCKNQSKMLVFLKNNSEILTVVCMYLCLLGSDDMRNFQGISTSDSRLHCNFVTHLKTYY